MTNLTGKFSCGSVKYSILGEPIFTYACHCRLRQRYTASAFLVHSPIEMSNFSLDQGDLVTTPGPSGSSGGHFIKRCKNCSNQIYSHFFGNSKVALLKTTTLDEANRFPPQAHIYVKNKLS